MVMELKIVAQRFDSDTGEIVDERLIFNKSVTAPKKIDDLGFSHKEQIKILEGSQEAILHGQETEINNKNITCPECGKKTKKKGKFQSAFHAVFTDHKISLQRARCICGWSSKISIDGTYGSALHPDLIELHGLSGSENSFQKVENYLNRRCCHKRPINNHERVNKTVKQVGEALCTLKKSNEWVLANKRSSSDELVINIDGGHINSNTPGKRSIEAIIATVHNPINIKVKDKNHKEITDKTVVASAKSDHQATIKNLLRNACLQQGMTKKTKLTVLSNGAKNCWSVIDDFKKSHAKIRTILDWFHIGMKFKNCEHIIPEVYKDEYDKAKWCLWHGNAEKSLSKLGKIISGMPEDKNKMSALMTYIKNNAKNIVDYQARKDSGLCFTSSLAESTVNTLINERQKNDGRMQWSREGANNVLQIRSSIQSKNWDNDWRLVKKHLYKIAA